MNGYRQYTEVDVDRLRLLIALRQLDLSLEQASELSGLCAEGHCDEVSQELRSLLVEKRRELARRVLELGRLDFRLAHLAGQLTDGKSPRSVISLRKEDR